ncbi:MULTISPECIES: helix-turn-helix transcriptional regulator [unclassified Roseitalea]|uniref:helix-turn-helix domain-containing protein n=1 Tax=unclassified Roseitalea TaxID=2639107 RepID=UPI00273F50F6|nr:MULTISPECIES: helix-turn-helix transcriptional regulator [unclassified Roseitalea]
MDRRSSFATMLTALRHERRLSQLDLAMEAEISQRHLSFLESGRSKPGSDVAAQLARALRLAPDLANAFMAEAGFAPIFRARPITDPAMAPLRTAAAHVLSGHMPYPAVLVDAVGDVLDANPAFGAILTLFGDPAKLWDRTHNGRPKNLYRLTLHPAGTAAALLNFEEVARATLQRVLREAQAGPRLTGLLEEIVGWDGIDPAWAKPDWGPPPAPIVAECYRIGREVLSIFAVTTRLGTAMEADVRGLRVESYFPADARTRQVMERLER